MDSENTQPEIIVSFDGVKMKDFRAYWTAVARGDWAGQDMFFALVVRSWLYDLNPADPESYGELAFEEYMAVQNAIKSASAAMGLEFAKQSQNKVGSR